MARNLYIHLLKTHPWKTNLTSAGVLMIGGDSMAQYIEHNPSVGDDFKSWLKSWKVDLTVAGDGDDNERASTSTNTNTDKNQLQNRGDEIPDRHFDNDEDVDKDEVAMLPAADIKARKKGKSATASAVKLRRMMTLDMRKYHHDRIEDRTKCVDVNTDPEQKSSNTTSTDNTFQLDTTRICSMMGWSVGIHAPSWIAIFKCFDKIFPGKMTPKSLVARVGFTAMCALPFNAAFFTYATCSHLLLEEMNMRRNSNNHVTVGDLKVLIRQMATETKLKLEREYVSTVVDSYQLWVPFNTINFAFVPPHLRMVALSVTTMFWNCYLSLAQHRDIPLPDYYMDHGNADGNADADASSTSIVGGGSRSPSCSGDGRLVG
mmetsp:Transcript_17313/g.26993  ORF Transcript_17313/g.26993 Transcript_17313/m.26993 type:complete len:374 (+) Transcript_17313:157-1278(+)